MVAVVAGMAWEWVSLCGQDPRGGIGWTLDMLLFGAVLCAFVGAVPQGLLLLALGAVLLWMLPGSRPHRRSLAAGVLYLGFAAIALPWMRADPAVGWANTVFLFAVVWASDIGAYLAGRAIGGAKLAPSISPGKTRSGAIGGLVCAALAGLAVAACVSKDFAPTRVMTVAAMLGVVAQAGDLLESALKRHFGVKDSGRIIPGHGGLLDRLDAVLTAAPAAALLAYIVGRGVVLWR